MNEGKIGILRGYASCFHTMKPITQNISINIIDYYKNERKYRKQGK